MRVLVHLRKHESVSESVSSRHDSDRLKRVSTGSVESDELVRPPRQFNDSSKVRKGNGDEQHDRLHDEQ